MFLLGKTRPNFSYLEEKLGIRNSDTLKERLLEKCKYVYFDRLARDVSPYLFDPNDAKKISLFQDYIKNIEF
jgi:hypothetical protein